MLFRKRKKTKMNGHNKENIENKSIEVIEQKENELVNIEEDFVPIEIEDLSMDYIVEDHRLHEIKDISVITRINSLIQTGSKQMFNTLQRDSVQKALKKAGTLYTSDIPKEHLTKAKDYPNGFRAFFRTDKIVKNAVLTEFNPSDISKATKIAKGAGQAMNIASLLVGQYYMSEINNKLNDLNKNINDVGNFQQREFKSKIINLITKAKEISTFSNEILELNELRKRELIHLNDHKNDASQLLTQVNLEIHDLSKDEVTKLKDYQIKVEEVEKLLNYQNILLNVLGEISKLDYTLNMGNVSIERTFSSYETLSANSNQSRSLIQDWHTNNIERLGIELDSNRIRRQGLEGLVAKPLLLIDKKWEYKDIDLKFINRVINQSQDEEIKELTLDFTFDDDLELIVKDGKYYYVKPDIHGNNI